MSQKDLTVKIREYREYHRMIEEMQAIKEAIADELKAYMQEAGESKMIIGEYKLSYTEVKRTEIDKKRFQAENADLYALYSKELAYMRFLVS